MKFMNPTNFERKMHWACHFYDQHRGIRAVISANFENDFGIAAKGWAYF